MKSDTKRSVAVGTQRKTERSFLRMAMLPLLALSLLLPIVPSASAKEAVAYFGTERGSGSLGGEFKFQGDSAINSTGAGPAEKGDIYVVDAGNERIQRFAQDDSGTPANPYDDTFPFISAWGADVDSTPTGGSNYEICTVAADCQAGVASLGNGTLAGNGVFDRPRAIAVDQDTGELYVVDGNSYRVDVYAGDGTFLRSFGWDVVEAGPDNAGAGFEVCIAASGDICKKGLPGAGSGQVGGVANGIGPGGIVVSPPDGNPTTGTVFLADTFNHRVNTYNLDGSFPSSFGSPADFGNAGPSSVTVDSRGIVYAEMLDSASSSSSQTISRYDSQNANGGGVGFLAPIPIPPLLSQQGSQSSGGLEVDPDSDGSGPDTDVLYALRGIIGNAVVQQFGPVNAPGLTAPPSAVDLVNGSVANFFSTSGLGVDDSNGRLFVSGGAVVAGEPAKSGVYVLDKAGSAVTATLDSLSDITATGVIAHATVNPNGPPDVSYQLEYSTDGTHWEKTPKALVGSQEIPQSIDATLSPGIGLQPNTLYHVRLVVTKAFTPAVVTAEKTFTTLTAPPTAETTGSPLRTSTTAQLGGRVTPRNSPTTYYFEYGDQGPCDSSPCASTSPQSAAAGAFTELVAERVGDLKAGTTYHYRLVADNGNSGSPAYGEDMTVVTRASDAPLSHGHFPGPPGSDRAYELVSPADTSGNPIYSTLGVSDDGSRSTYAIAGGTPGSETGSFASFHLSERTPSGWQAKSVVPPRGELVGSGLSLSGATPDFSSLALWNFNEATHESTAWKLSPTAPPVRLSSVVPPQEPGFSGALRASKDPFRVFQALGGGSGFDPAYPGAAAHQNIYEITSGTPRLVSIMPDGSVPPCGVTSNGGLGTETPTPDGSRVFFQSSTSTTCPTTEGLHDPQQYLRNLDAGTTTLLSGWEGLITATNDAAYFLTKQRLVPEDTIPAAAGLGTDVYRYELTDGSLECLTCVMPGGAEADVNGASVAEGGSRIYFSSFSPQPLLPGAIPGGGTLYVLETETGELRWVGPVSNGEGHGPVVLFSSSDPRLNLPGGLDNGGTSQVYRYDDEDRSLVCVSCPQDGSPASAPATRGVLAKSETKDVAFTSTAPLVPGDQNTAGPSQDPAAGTDVYEWRDGRLLLVTDGLSNWPNEGGVYPKVVGFSDNGRDLEFTASARYTPDALDSYLRLYDARIGGGFEFPAAPKPCPLEVCQGTPKGAPEEAAPGTGSFAGPGDLKEGAKAKKHKKKAHKKRPRKHRANHKRRASR